MFQSIIFFKIPLYLVHISICQAYRRTFPTRITNYINFPDNSFSVLCLLTRGHTGTLSYSYLWSGLLLLFHFLQGLPVHPLLYPFPVPALPLFRSIIRFLPVWTFPATSSTSFLPLINNSCFSSILPKHKISNQ